MSKEALQVSYSQHLFRRVSWASRPHMAMCWCTCGNGRCLSTCSRSPCAEQISTLRSPLAFCFCCKKKKKKANNQYNETDEKGSTIHHSMRNRFQPFVFSDGLRQKLREMDTDPLSDHSPFAVTQTPRHYSGCPHVLEENKESLTCGL